MFLTLCVLNARRSGLAGTPSSTAGSLGGLPQISLWPYLVSAEFAVDVAENWQSEYLQFFLYIVLTVWLVQRGSPESKALDQARPGVGRGPKAEYSRPGSPAWAGRAGWRPTLYSNSLGLVMGLIFLLLAGPVDRRAQRVQRGATRRPAGTVSWVRYL